MTKALPGSDYNTFLSNIYIKKMCHYLSYVTLTTFMTLVMVIICHKLSFIIRPKLSVIISVPMQGNFLADFTTVSGLMSGILNPHPPPEICQKKPARFLGYHRPGI